MSDPPHLLKCIRNNFLNKDIDIDFDNPRLKDDRKIGSWDHIIKAFEIDVHWKFLERHMPKLIEQHVYPEKINKMKVKFMMQVFSKQAYTFIEILARSQGTGINYKQLN